MEEEDRRISSYHVKRCWVMQELTKEKREKKKIRTVRSRLARRQRLEERHLMRLEILNSVTGAWTRDCGTLWFLSHEGRSCLVLGHMEWLLGPLLAMSDKEIDEVTGAVSC